MMFAPVGVRFLKNESGTSGELERTSITRNACEQCGGADERAITWAEPQAVVVDCVSPKTRVVRPR
jgi:hypothetical protein